jgi:hypothetical protein
MPHILTNAEYADMLYVYGFCDGSAIAATEEYRRLFPKSRIPDLRMFSKMFSTLRECGARPSAYVSSERAHQQHAEEQETILKMVHRRPTSNTRRLSTRLSVSGTRVW